MRTRSLILLVLLVTLAFLGNAWLIVQLCLAADYTGKVVGVNDGDTIEVLNGHHTERIRLSGIDCPAKDSPSPSQQDEGRMAEKKQSADVTVTAFEILQAVTGELPCHASPNWERVRQEESPAEELRRPGEPAGRG